MAPRKRFLSIRTIRKRVGPLCGSDSFRAAQTSHHNTNFNIVHNTCGPLVANNGREPPQLRSLQRAGRDRRTACCTCPVRSCKALGTRPSKRVYTFLHLRHSILVFRNCRCHLGSVQGNSIKSLCRLLYDMAGPLVDGLAADGSSHDTAR